ncbi:Lrp/AsnC family transcriptional regulator [Phaeovulum vinaykumarii]|uniref:Transcriptional regulator, AsnC family n=1 Tax=Phaeovulum vinaykumarii TaxID=407234 RepID=A0A1N7MVP0_9RHOB|nr:Lrp/AsnC family transcriptional regulator [Phaeovulum vinaykumarii]SIS90156.1 transcriptional regulator, AsnC family [Phaeovulum vinaykumarii]SOC16747.1 AsnC family transcriptional regulator [Phaeovulum vinaykumarii]
MDRKILDILQHDATVPIARIARQVGLSQTPFWKRIRKHEAAGVIRARVALLDPDALGLSLTAFILLEAADQSPEWRQDFLAAMDGFEAVCEVHRLAGCHDYLLRGIVPDMAAYERFNDQLTARVRLRRVNLLFALEKLRGCTALPLGGHETDPAGALNAG